MRAGAIDQRRTTLDHDIGIAADHEQLARQHGFEPRAIVVRRLGLVVLEARADHIVGAFRWREVHVQAREDRAVALGPEMVERLSMPLLDRGAGEIARGNDGVIGLARHVQTLELAHHLFARARRIGNKDDHAAARAHAHQRVAGMRKRGDAVVDDAPHVARAPRHSRAPARKISGLVTSKSHSYNVLVIPGPALAGRPGMTRLVWHQFAKARYQLAARSAPGPSFSAAPGFSAPDVEPCSASARTGRGGENRKPWPKRTS